MPSRKHLLSLHNLCLKHHFSYTENLYRAIFFHFFLVGFAMADSNLFTLSVPTSMGRFEIVASSVGLRGVYWPGEKARCETTVYPVSDAPVKIAKLLKTTAKQLADYCKGKNVGFTAGLDLSGLTPFTQKVLRTLAKVPYGKTITYGELAKRAGSAKAARAVGNILAKNPLPIVVPCHRVVAGDGNLGGFSAPGGVKVKRRLLLMEDNCLKKKPR